MKMNYLPAAVTTVFAVYVDTEHVVQQRQAGQARGGLAAQHTQLLHGQVAQRLEPSGDIGRIQIHYMSLLFLCL